MKALALFITLLIINFSTHAQDTKGVTITVTVPNVTNSEGKVLFGLYTEDTFMKAAPIASEKSKIIDGVAKITFVNVPAGTYGISCYHDANNNNQMDFKPTGMPKESYAVSNNAMSYGPPMWSEVKFEVGSKNMTMELRM